MRPGSRRRFWFEAPRYSKPKKAAMTKLPEHVCDMCGLPESDEDHSDDPAEPWKHGFIPRAKCRVCGEGPFYSDHRKHAVLHHDFEPEEPGHG